MTASLLDPAFLRELERLRVALRRRVAGTRAGERRGFRRGASVEFAEHRAYAPGDDPRRIDWNAWARLDELVVRLFVAEEDVTLHLLVDASASMGFGTPTKLDTARRLAAALGYLALHGSERVALHVGASAASKPLRGKGSVRALVERLEGLRAAGAARLEAAAGQVLGQRGGGPGFVVVLSDLLDEGSARRAATRLAAARHETVVIHLLADEELSPVGDGASVLCDSESGAELELVVDDEARAAYARALAGFLDETARSLRAQGVRYVQGFPGRSAFAVLTEVLTGRAAGGAAWSS